MKIGGTITVGELIEELKKFPEDLEVLMAINESSGFPDDRIETYPIEDVFSANVNEPSNPPFEWWYKIGSSDDKVMLYVFP